MQPHYKTFSTLTLAALLFCSTPLMAAESPMNNNVVHSKDGQVVRSRAFGTCVRTKWEHGSDICPSSSQKAVVKHALIDQPRTTFEEERSVYFKFNESNLTSDAKRRLETFSEEMRQAENIASIEIVGFADRIGSNSDNQELSVRRAQAVKDYLKTYGYLETHIPKVRGVGELRPMTSCNTNMSREKTIRCLTSDRRVAINVRYTKASL